MLLWKQSSHHLRKGDNNVNKHLFLHSAKIKKKNWLMKTSTKLAGSSSLSLSRASSCKTSSTVNLGCFGLFCDISADYFQTIAPHETKEMSVKESNSLMVVSCSNKADTAADLDCITLTVKFRYWSGSAAQCNGENPVAVLKELYLFLIVCISLSIQTSINPYPSGSACACSDPQHSGNARVCFPP